MQGLIMFAMALLIVVLNSALIKETTNGIVIIGFNVLIVIFIIAIARMSKKDKQREQERILDKKKNTDEHLLNTYGLPIDCPSFKYLNGYSKISDKALVNAWVSTSKLNLLVQGNEIQKYEIPLENINFYTVKGDISQEMETKGGNLSVGETMMTEGLFGTATAMKRNQVVQNIKTIDQRKTIINAIVDEKNSFIFFEGAELYNYLLENIPEKEQTFITMNK